jgi:dTMP kinase
MKQALLTNFSTNMTFADINDAGLLIAFEGPDGSGKTTQRKLLKSWLQSMGEEVVVTKWNSSPLFKPLIKARKADRSLDPESYATLHAADFRHRYENIIKPALADAQIVIADRYIFTGIARDAARGMDRDWSLELYSGFRKPDLVFYFKAPVDTCAQRIASSREIRFYEAGQDITGLDDPYESYLRFSSRVVSEYDSLHRQLGFVIVNAERPIYEQHRFIREIYLQECARSALSEFECQLDAVPIPS